MAKNPQKWLLLIKKILENGQKMTKMAIFGGEDEFSWTCDQLESCREWSKLSKYEVSAKSLEPFLRK